MLYEDITYKVIGCAMKVHQTLGSGFQELIYQRCLALEMDKANLVFLREVDQKIFYDGVEVGTRRADFVVEEKIIVELKALTDLEDVHLAQGKELCCCLRFSSWAVNKFGSKKPSV